MSTRSERDRQKALQDKHQMILSQLLKDEDNKYCVDCDAKGPRWASWNLGIFLCIRCAGLHRNLGVHISRVKSVNLDTWTPEQVAMVQEMGNSRARAVYEANVPDSFRRPQSDSGLEAFIRAKYEHKKYIAREWVPPKPTVPKYDDDGNEIRGKPTPMRNTRNPVFEEMPKREKKKTRPKEEHVQLRSAPANPPVSAAKIETAAVSRPHAQPKQNIDNLLGLDDPAPVPAVNDDPFGAFVGNTNIPTSQPAASNPPTSSSQMPFSNENLLGSVVSTEQQNGDIQNGGVEATSAADGEQKKSKESILALFGNTSQQQQQMYGVPGGMYMQQPGGQMPGMYGAQMPNGMSGMMPAQNMMATMPMQQIPNQTWNGMHNGVMGGQMNMSGMNPMGAMGQQQMGGQMSNMGAQMGTIGTQMGTMGTQMGTMGTQMGTMGGQMGGMNTMPVSSSMNSMASHQQMPATGGMYSNAMPNNVYANQLQQTQQQMAALGMGGQPASGFGGQMGTVSAGGGGGGMGMGGGWGGMQQTGNTMSTNLWQ